MAHVWYGPQAKAHVKDMVSLRVSAAGRVFRDLIRKATSQMRSPPTSAAGEYPHQSAGLGFGHLTRNIQMEFDRATVTARVGTNVLYGKLLETGTRKMAARPLLSNAIRDFSSNVRAVLEGRLG